MLKRIFLYILVVCCIFTSCKNEDTEPGEHSARTVLVYMISSNLGNYMQNNINSMIAGATPENLNYGHLVVFYSKNSKEAELFEIKQGANGVVTRNHIKDYTDQSAVSPDVMMGVIKDVVDLYPSDSYGMVLSSHGTSWLPTEYKNMLRSFGEENGKKMEINELAKGIPDNLFDYLLFDACYMGSIECIYELKNKADYIISSPTEVLADGFPYSKIISNLFANIPQLENVVDAFYNYYQNSSSPYATVSLTKTSELENLANISREIITGSGMETIYSLPLSDMQILERLSTYGPFLLYDFDDYISRLATNEQYSRFSAAMQKAIIRKHSTKESYYMAPGRPYPINHFSGLSTYIPQEKRTKLNEWYQQLMWYQSAYK